MLSILIPIYNCDVTALVMDLKDQARYIKEPVEIICIDDGSAEIWKQINRPLIESENVIYKQLPANIGRSKIRNMLADHAHYPFLLFLDSDSKIIRSDFLESYRKVCRAPSVTIGGRVYPEKCPTDANVLHWKYGITREQHAKGAFQSNNFLIHADLFNRIRFDNLLEGYGHEDTLFGHCLAQKRITIDYIDNPVLHDKLETSQMFLKNQRNALANLYALKKRKPDIETRLTRTIQHLEALRLSLIMQWMFSCFHTLIKKNLIGRNPSLLILDLYKVACYLEIKERHKKEKRPSRDSLFFSD